MGSILNVWGRRGEGQIAPGNKDRSRLKPRVFFPLRIPNLLPVFANAQAAHILAEQPQSNVRLSLFGLDELAADPFDGSQ